MSRKLLIKNIGTLQTAAGSLPLSGVCQKQNIKLKNAAITCENGVITGVYDEQVPINENDFTVIDAKGKLVTPGLVDAHTHLVFGGWRQHEIPLKIAGKGYLDILKSGGGILSTVRATRQASEQELLEKSAAFLNDMMALGVTTCEAKSGYGLDLENELKQLNVIKKLDEIHPMDVVPTFMGAHAIPDDYAGRADDYIDYLCGAVIPEVAKRGLARFCDVFCEDSVFTGAQSRRLLECAQAHGMKVKIHADEIEEIGGAVLAGEIGAVSAEHLIATGESGMASMAKGGVIAVLLPQTSMYLGKNYAPARRMTELGIPVAVASDFNPGSCPSLNMQMAICLASTKYKLFPEEVLTAVTLNAACAIGKGDALGTIEVGKQADIVIWDVPDFESVCYRFGSNLVDAVVKKGAVWTKKGDR